jgi:Fe-S oxidoreductase
MLFNSRNRLWGLAWLSERWLGLSAKRALPSWRSDWFKDTPSADDGDGAEIVLWVDTFNTFFEPENARAAVRVLEAAGYRVTIARDAAGGRPLCCGRTFLNAGMVDEARFEMRRVLDTLRPYADRGVPIVGLEPSCLLTLRDEAEALFTPDELGTVPQRAVLLEEFLRTEAIAGRIDLALRKLPVGRVLLHGHCHQKAFGTVASVAGVLGWIPDLEVEVIDSGCCGMAGSFGYEAEHYDLSMKMGELDLLPAVRSSGDNAWIVTDGTSCRRQILDGTGRRALHTVRVLEAALAE